LAPTGVAALNVQGQTIHSFFRFKPDITLEKIRKIKTRRGRIFKEIDAIVIDEISMVRADLLDCIDKFLRLNGKNPRELFGGIQMIFIGDLYQLPPVVTAKEKEIFTRHYRSPYFFSAHVFNGFPLEFIELEKIYRQKDQNFIILLNAIRNNSVSDEMLSMLNKRVGVSPRPGGNEFTIHLTTTNQMAAEINAGHVRQLKTKLHTYQSEVAGDFEERSFPADEMLQIGAGAQVMLLNNDSRGRWVNGSIGKVEEIIYDAELDKDIIRVRLQDNTVQEVLPHSWELFHYHYNEAIAAIDTESVGVFTQYPLKLAWAITIHKSQGKTFHKVIIDMGTGAFSYGQTYVALSRCTSLEGIILKRPIKKSDVRMDWNIVQFLTEHQYALSERDLPFETKLKLIQRAIEQDSYLEIVYLKASDEKTRRIIKPLKVGERMYKEKPFIGLEAYCTKREDARVFRVDRILEIRLSEDNVLKAVL
jgi:ATP-dependent exoDNAse (exonuclease V), alpha subunit - helicase superfamily I member